MPAPNPILLIQNRLAALLGSGEERRELYRAVLLRRLDRAERGGAGIGVPRRRGLRLRLPGKSFHATPELFFQEGGTTRFDLPHETVTAGPGAAVLIPAGMPHGERWEGRAFLNLIVMFQPESFSCHLGYREGGKGLLRCGPIDRFPGPERFAVLRHVEELAETTEDGAASPRLRRGLYQALLARLYRGMEPPRSGPEGPDGLNGLAARCGEMLDVHFARMDFSVAWLARELGCSPDHLSRHFRRRTGLRIVEAVHRRRVAHARALLRDSDMNVAEVAWACGFSQPSYFDRVFRAFTGGTPGEFRRRKGEGRKGVASRAG